MIYISRTIWGTHLAFRWWTQFCPIKPELSSKKYTNKSQNYNQSNRDNQQQFLHPLIHKGARTVPQGKICRGAADNVLRHFFRGTKSWCLGGTSVSISIVRWRPEPETSWKCQKFLPPSIRTRLNGNGQDRAQMEHCWIIRLTWV